jgi:hypothetical protein
MNQKYISKDKELIEQLKDTFNENQVVLLSAPCGIGKTYFFCKELKANVVVPYKNAATQIENLYGLERIIGEQKSANFDEEKSYVATFASATAIHLETSEYLCVDEVHELINFSDFAARSYRNVIKLINEAKVKNKKIILITATPETILPIAKYLGVDIYISIKKKGSSKIKKNKLNIFITNGDRKSFLDYIKENELKYKNDDSQAMVLLEFVDDTRYIGNRFIEDSLVINSKTKESLEVRDFIKNETTNKQIIVGTSMLSSSINIKNVNVKRIYCNRLSRELIIQFVNRIRENEGGFEVTIPFDLKREEEKEYLPNATYDELLEEYEAIVKQLKEIIELASKPINRTFNAMKEGLLKTWREQIYEEDGEIKINHSAIWKMLIEEKEYVFWADLDNVIEFFTNAVDVEDVEYSSSNQHSAKERKEILERQQKQTKVNHYLREEGLLDTKLESSMKKKIVQDLNELGVDDRKQLAALLKLYGYKVENTKNYSHFWIKQEDTP